MILFETERLAVRRLTKDDAEAMAKIYGDPEVVRYVGDSRPLPVEICSHWIDVTDGNFERRGYGMVAACDRESGELIACIGVVHPGQQEEPEIKYAIRRDYWGKGLATELVAGLVRYAHDQLGKKRLMATVFPENAASQNVLTKVGFTRAADRVGDDGPPIQVWTWQAA